MGKRKEKSDVTRGPILSDEDFARANAEAVARQMLKKEMPERESRDASAVRKQRR